jgi:hypothetical protein
MDTSTQAIHVKGKERRIVEVALEPDPSGLARVYGVNANSLFGWQPLYLEGQTEPK